MYSYVDENIETFALLGLSVYVRVTMKRTITSGERIEGSDETPYTRNATLQFILHP